MRFDTLEPNAVIYWVRSYWTGGKDRVAMYYKGRWKNNCADGMRGDVRARPVQLGPGEFTATYAPDAFETESGEAIS